MIYLKHRFKCGQLLSIHYSGGGALLVNRCSYWIAQIYKFLPHRRWLCTETKITVVTDGSD